MTTAAFESFVWAWIAIALMVFLVLLYIPAPYGRHTKKNWGPMIPNRIGWFFMELPALVVFAYFVLRGGGTQNVIIMVAAALWIIHYTNRALLFPLRIKTAQKKMPLAIAGMAFFFNVINGFVNGYWFGYLSDPYPDNWLYDPRFIIGIVLFITGFAINQYYDHQLIGLRRNHENSYVIPRGGLFDYVSCPNFFGEILEWLGFAILTWCLPSFSFFIWSACNLIPRAIDHHRWYQTYFEDYPENRKAVILYVI